MTLEIIDIEYDVEREDPSGTVTYICPWEEASANAQWLVGGLQTSWQDPQYFPISGLTGLKCKKAKVTKFGSGTWNSTGGFKDAQIVAEFAPLKLIQGGGGGSNTLYEFSCTTSAQGIQTPTGYFKWNSGARTGESIDENDAQPNILITMSEISLKLPYCKTDGLGAIHNMEGKINSSSMVITPSLTADAETVLFVGGDVECTLSSDCQNLQWKRNLKFQMGQYSFNKLPCKQANGTLTWEYITPLQYGTGNLYLLLAN